MSDFDFDLLQEAIAEAPTAGYGPQRNFGKMIAIVTVLHWDSGKPTETPFTNQKLGNGEYLRLNFESDLSEFNSALVNPYKRRVDVKKSGPKSKTDFSETVEPSLKETLGKDWAKKITKGIYCEWEDADTVETNKQGELKGWDKDGKHFTNTIPCFLRVFKSKAECETARAERFNRSSSSNGSIPADVIGQVQGLLKAGLDDEQLQEVLKGSFPLYSVEELIAAANPL